MIPIWWALMRFLKAVFVPPKFTELEEALFNQIHNLESQLHREQERYLELTNKIMFPEHVVVEAQPTGPHGVVPSMNKDALERKRLEDASKARWQEHIARQEARANELVKLDEARAKDARNEATAGQSS